MKYLKKFNESDVYDVFDDMIKDGNVIKFIGGVRQYDKIYQQLSDKRDNVSQGDLDFISKLFKDDLVLNEKIFYKKQLVQCARWRHEDWRDYRKWKNSKHQEEK